MRKHDLQPTPDNIRNTFIRDSIGRNKDLDNFIKIINSIDESYSIALDSYWGSGKTFFVNQVKMILDAKTEESYGEVEGKEQILSTWERISQNMTLKKYVPIYYDAWQNDCDDDPIYSLIYQMTLDTENIKVLKDRINFSDVLNVAGKITGVIAGKLSEHLAGVNPNEIVEDLRKGDFLKTLRARKEIDKRIEEYIGKLLPKGCDRLLIIIDELDRCNPEFAVKLLERIKHYFNNEKVTFVFSVNLAELQHTIKRHYGSGFDASRYIDRFFDLRVTLPQIDRFNMLSYIGGPALDQQVLIAVWDYFNMQIRDCIRLVSVLKVIDNVKRSSEMLEIQNTYLLLNNVIFPFTYGLKLSNIEKYNSFISGSDVTPLDDFLLEEKNYKKAEQYLEYIIPDNVEYSSIGGRMNCSPTVPIPPIHQFYNGLFSSEYVVNIHNCRIMQNQRDYFFKTLTLLSDNIVIEEKLEV